MYGSTCWSKYNRRVEASNTVGKNATRLASCITTGDALSPFLTSTTTNAPILGNWWIMENGTAEFRDYEATRTFVVGVVFEVRNLAGSGESGLVNSD